MMFIADAITVAALFALALASWHPNQAASRPAIRAGLALLASAGLSIILSGNLLTLALLLLDVVLVTVTWWLAQVGRMKTVVGTLWMIVLVAVLLFAKLPYTQSLIGVGAWIGISYLVFRLLHIAFDARRERLGDATLAETMEYALHPATLSAGPIDRVQHSVSEQRHEPGKEAGSRSAAQETSDGLWRLFIGLFKKAVLANLFYVVVQAHDMTLQPDQPVGIAWLWLIAYAFYLYFDFAAYSDIAIGIGRLMGLRLPENFANPYAQPTIARFWQAWHITLSNWLRDYIFFPISRSLLKKYGQHYTTPILFVSHMTTMITCGLWHGLGSGFVAWGAWHGLGLFGYSQVPGWRRRFRLPVLPTPLSVLLTFAFVTLGWVFFSTDFPTAMRIFGRLFGVS